MIAENNEVAITCPNCGPTTKLIVKTNGKENTQFLGCPNWPGCDHTQPLPEDLKMTEAGARRLPGF